MEKGYISTEIKKRISDLPRGTIVTIDKFPHHWSRGAVSKALLRFYGEGLLERHTKGVYSKAVSTRFGKASASELEVVSNLVAEGGKMFGGLFLFSNLGLSSQNPKTVEILNNNSTYDLNIGNLKVHFRRIKPRITETSRPHIELMEVLRELSLISDSSRSEVIKWVIERTRKLSDIEERALFSIAKTYPPHLRALLGALTEMERSSLAEKLKGTLKTTSVYKVSNLSNYVKNPFGWGLRFEIA